MLIANHNHLQAPIEAPDDSLVIAAESEYIRNAIGDARKHLDDADNAAGNENAWKARQAIQSALDCLSDLMED